MYLIFGKASCRITALAEPQNGHNNGNAKIPCDFGPLERRGHSSDLAKNLHTALTEKHPRRTGSRGMRN